MAGVLAPQMLRRRVRKQHLGTFCLNQTVPYTAGLVWGSQATIHACIPIQPGAIALRVGFVNPTAATYAVSGVCFCPSSTANDYVNPTGSGSWVYSTWNNSGAINGANDIPYVAGGAPAAATIAANATNAVTGATDIPAYYWTDLNNFSSVDPTTGAAYPYLIVRAWANAAQTWGVITNSTATDYTGAGTSVNYDQDFSVRHKGSDNVTTPTTNVTGTGTTTIHPFGAFQILYKNPIVQLTAMGDSHFGGDQTYGGCTPFFAKAALKWNWTGGKTPIIHWNSAWGGATSNRFWPVAINAVTYSKPGICVISGWTANDNRTTKAHIDAYHTRCIYLAQQVVEGGGIPIFVTPFPRDAATMTASVLSAWQYARDQVMSTANNNMLVFDATPLIANMSTGTYLPGMSSDNIHPNNTGHGVLADEFIKLLNQIIE